MNQPVQIEIVFPRSGQQATVMVPAHIAAHFNGLRIDQGAYLALPASAKPSGVSG